MSAAGDPFEPFRDNARARAILADIEASLAGLGRGIKFMEVCGTHTMSAARSGLHSILPQGLKLSSGPGCPVCVTPPGYVVAACELARRQGTVVATFGDMVRVPGAGRTLDEERASGADVRIVYSPMDALGFAASDPSREYVFLGVGFETTAPTVAATIIAAARTGVKNFSVLTAHKTMPRAMRAVLDAPELGVEGFLCPGHVSIVTGTSIYDFIPAEYGVPCAIAGFEPVDMLLGVSELLRMKAGGVPAVVNTYGRAVRVNGNVEARRILDDVFEPCDAEWRGIGVIPGSGLAIRAEYSGFAAEKKLGIAVPEIVPPKGCLCGEILRGAAEPSDCALFDAVCAPSNPIGACMVSSEGACAAAWKFRPESRARRSAR